MEKAKATHSSTLAWKIPWTEEPGGLQSMGLLRVGHNWATSLWLFTFLHWRRNWQPTPVFLPGESQGRGSLVGCRLWGRQSRTQLKRRSSSSKLIHISANGTISFLLMAKKRYSFLVCLFLAALSLHCCTRASSLQWLLLLKSTGSRHVGFSMLVGSLVVDPAWALEHRFNSCGARAY